MLKTRVITALVLVLAFLAALAFLPPAGWAVFCALMLVPAAWEWADLIKFRAGKRILYVIAVLALCTILYLAGERGLLAGGPRLLVYAGAGIFWMVVVPLWLGRGQLPRARWIGALTGMIVLVPTWLALVELHGLGPVLLFLLMAVAWISDIAAYFAGRRFGRHKLAPGISPGKTWEGVAGAMLAVSAYAVVWTAALHPYFPRLLKTAPFGWIWMILFLCLLAAIGIYGDLLESALKRQAGVKDSGTLLPGHGGVLDRVDALTSVLPVAALAYFL